MAAPKPAAERKMTALMGALVPLCFSGVPIALTWRLHAELSGGLSFPEAFTHLGTSPGSA